MVQPGSAAATWAGNSDRCGAPVPPSGCAAAVTGRGLPGRYGAATSPGTSTGTVPPGGTPATCDGAGVVPPAPSTRTVNGPAGSDASLITLTWMIWRGRAGVPANRSVESTEVMRIP